MTFRIVSSLNLPILIPNYLMTNIAINLHTMELLDKDNIDKRSNPSSSASATSERLGSSPCGTSCLRDFHFIEFRPADFHNCRSVSYERLLRAPQHLRLRLRCFP